MLGQSAVKAWIADLLLLPCEGGSERVNRSTLVFVPIGLLKLNSPQNHAVSFQDALFGARLAITSSTVLTG